MKSKVFALVCALLLISVAALADVQKDEIIYARLGNAGKMDESYVVNAFSADAAGDYKDFGDYAAAIPLTPGLSATLSDGAVALRLPEGRSYYQGTPRDLALPWDIAIQYTLDGAAVDASALKGANGQVGIEIGVSPNAAAPDGWYGAFTLQVTATLDASLCEDVVAEGATIACAGSNYTVSWIVTPGGDSTLALSASAKDFRMDPIQFAGIRLTVQVDDATFSGSLTALADGADALSTGAETLSTNLSDAASGAGMLSDNADTLGDALTAFGEKLTDAALSAEFQALLSGYQGIASGVDTLASGIASASDGAAQVSESAAQFASGVENMDVGGMVKGAFGGEFAMRSYLSDQNADTRSVQFVLMTPGID